MKDVTALEAEVSRLRAENVQLREDLEALLDGPSLCSADVCGMYCGFGHLQGCDAIKEFLKDQKPQINIITEE